MVMSGALRRVARSAGDRSRREEKFHALDVPGRCADTLVHVPATNPLCAGRHSNLVAASVVADRGARGVGSVEDNHRKAAVNCYRKGYLRCRGWSHASCNRDWLPTHSSRGSEA